MFVFCDISQSLMGLFFFVDQDIVGTANSLTSNIDKLDKWSKQWVVEFNPKKTISLNFTRKNIFHPLINIVNNGPEIKQSNNHVHLGLNFQSDASTRYL